MLDFIFFLLLFLLFVPLYFSHSLFSFSPFKYTNLSTLDLLLANPNKRLTHCISKYVNCEIQGY